MEGVRWYECQWAVIAVGNDAPLKYRSLSCRTHTGKGKERAAVERGVGTVVRFLNDLLTVGHGRLDLREG